MLLGRLQLKKGSLQLTLPCLGPALVVESMDLCVKIPVLSAACHSGTTVFP